MIRIKFLSLFLATLVFGQALGVLPVWADSTSNDYSYASDPNPISIKGDSVEYFYNENRAEGKGNVRIVYGEKELTADEIEVNLKTKEAWARGNVIYTTEEEKYEGSAIYVNFDTGETDADGKTKIDPNKITANVEDLKLTVAPYFRGESESAKKISDDMYQFNGAYITTCEEGKNCPDGKTPLYRLQSSQIDYYPDDRLVLKHTVLYLGYAPILYLPLLVIPIRDYDQFPVQVEFGKNSEWGAFVLSKWRYYLNKDHDGNILLDQRENQGFAYGVEHFYHNTPIGEGAVRSYILDDRCDDADCSRSKSYSNESSSRYRVQARHHGEIAEDTGLNFELNKMSDERVIQDFFFRDEYERIAFPDNYLSIVQAKEEYSTSILTRYRVDQFVGVTERLPEVRFEKHTAPIGDSPFYWGVKTQAAYLNNTFKNREEENANQNAGRMEARPRLSYVFKAPGDITITPFVGSRHTFYTRDADGNERDFVRNNAEAGVDASTKYFKVYDAQFDALGIQFERMRHVFTPTLSYFYQSSPTHPADSLFKFDNVDTISHESTLTIDIENKLQIKYLDPEHPESSSLIDRDLLRSIVQFNLEMPQANASRLHNIISELEFRPYTWLSTQLDTTYLFEEDHFSDINFDINAHKGPLTFTIGQRYTNDTSNQTTARVAWQINPEWKIEVYERFDFKRDSSSEGGRNNEFQMVLEKRNFFCWTIRLIYDRSHRENGFFVTLSPSAYPESAYRRVKQLAAVDPAFRQFE